MRTMWVMAGLLAGAGTLAVPSEAKADARVGIFLTHDNGYYGGGYDRGRDGYGARNTFQIGYQRGLRDGFDHGRKDGHRADFNFWHDRKYRNGDAGYHSEYGPRSEYASGYRRGYEQGYRRSYARSDYDHGRGRWDDNYRNYDDDGGRIINEDPYRR